MLKTEERSPIPIKRMLEFFSHLDLELAKPVAKYPLILSQAPLHSDVTVLDPGQAAPSTAEGQALLISLYFSLQTRQFVPALS